MFAILGDWVSSRFPNERIFHMTFSLENLGCNCGHLSPEAIKALGYHFIETSFWQRDAYEDMVPKILKALDAAKAMAMPYAIHLPVYLSDQWRADHGFYDAFFLDPDPKLRERSFAMLEENLSRLSQTYQPMYYVLHFPGIYPAETLYEEGFDVVLQDSLQRLDALARQYSSTLAVEYFATNARFADYREWLAALAPYERLKPLLDTGHLYFNCHKNGYDYDEVIQGLAPHCIGFHLWNICGEGYYDESECYQKYHHIVPHLGQSRETGWAFDPEKLIPYLAQFDKPLLIEAGQRFNGLDYFMEGLVQIREMLKNID